MRRFSHIIMRHLSCMGQGCPRCEGKGYSIYSDLSVFPSNFFDDWLILESLEHGADHWIFTAKALDQFGDGRLWIPRQSGIYPKIARGDIVRIHVLNTPLIDHIITSRIETDPLDLQLFSIQYDKLLQYGFSRDHDPKILMVRVVNFKS